MSTIMRMFSSMFPGVRLQSFNSPTAVDGGYAILSHVCPKVREIHRLARSYDLPWFWIDAPCIDRQSSAELSEAIRSMYKWYSQSSICFVYLADVPSDSSLISAPNSAFRRSKYFFRGWTLQELIAPRRVIFLSKDWTVLGEKHELAGLLEEITGFFQKVRRFCAFARAEGFEWAWLDACCIDKTSSSELSEALNSMFRWYQDAVVCYASLHDVSDRSNATSPTVDDDDDDVE
ncbi:Vegetative incompatibility protein HET-E-1 [Trametes pubescens]|uniref:Vegetative incompatibility protein HET-E-1 n=1 Tax=Trametes pubescens TaxID=154538 RepID=A0A1M2VGH3_TRAPU|nr:Vegetative incompatibility protein HET-E-1 [Trametes pubescens]